MPTINNRSSAIQSLRKNLNDVRNALQDDLRFPLDVAQSFTHPDIIVISIIKRDGIKLNGLATKFKSTLDATNPALAERIREANASNAAAKAVKQQAEEDQSFLSTVGNFFGRASDEVSEILSFGTENVSSSLVDTLTFARKTAKSSEKRIRSVFLPMPDNVTYTDQIEWEGSDLGALGGAAKGESGSLKSAGIANMGTIISGGAGSLVGAVLGSGTLGGAAGALLGGDAIQKVGESTLRIKANPFKEQTFQGVPFRPFEFSWTFSPRNLDEVKMLKDIIKAFRENSRPEYGDGGAAIFKYPNEMNISFLTLNHETDTLDRNIYLPKLKTCICKSINTNFATAGWHSFDAGAPTSVTIQMTFEEVDIVTAEDVREDF